VRVARCRTSIETYIECIETYIDTLHIKSMYVVYLCMYVGWYSCIRMSARVVGRHAAAGTSDCSVLVGRDFSQHDGFCVDLTGRDTLRGLDWAGLGWTGLGCAALSPSCHVSELPAVSSSNAESAVLCRAVRLLVAAVRCRRSAQPQLNASSSSGSSMAAGEHE